MSQGLLTKDRNMDQTHSNPNENAPTDLQLRHEAEADLLPERTPVVISAGSPSGPVLDILPSKKQVRTGSEIRSRPGMLQDEARLLYNAMSFKVWSDGRGFDTLISVSARYLGITSHAEFAALIPEMNKAIKAWLANGCDKTRQRYSRRCRPVPKQDHWYIYVVERGYRHGLHIHELCMVPRELQTAFRVFLKGWWEGQAGMAVPENAVHVKFARSANAYAQYERHQFLFRYMIKTINPDLVARHRDGSFRPAVEVMKPLWRFGLKPDFLPIACRQLYGISRNLDRAAQAEAGFRSKFDQGRLGELYDGSEVRAGVLRSWGFPPEF